MTRGDTITTGKFRVDLQVAWFLLTNSLFSGIGEKRFRSRFDAKSLVEALLVTRTCFVSFCCIDIVIFWMCKSPGNVVEGIFFLIVCSIKNINKFVLNYEIL